MVSFLLSLVSGLTVQGSLDSAISPRIGIEVLLVQATLLLAHVMPTFWMPHKAFDREHEKWQAFVYVHAGPFGFGIVMGSFLAAAWMPVPFERTGGLTVSSGVMLVVALVVAQAYWSNHVMSEGFDWETFVRTVSDPDLIYIAGALRDLGYHYRMRELGNASVRRSIHTLPSEWEEQTRLRLVRADCSRQDVEQGLGKVTALRRQYAQPLETAA